MKKDLIPVIIAFILGFILGYLLESGIEWLILKIFEDLF